VNSKQDLCDGGEKLMRLFCKENQITPPDFIRLGPEDRFYDLRTCAFYRPTTIRIMVNKTAALGMGGRAWSWPGYVIDRTAYGVVQHELGHHVDHFKSTPEKLFSKWVCARSGESPLTGYLGTDNHADTYYMEWFAEHFRLYATNPDLCGLLRPKFCAAMLLAQIKPVVKGDWFEVLTGHGAPERITTQALKKILVTF
jgi:hypothetical protein